MLPDDDENLWGLWEATNGVDGQAWDLVLINFPTHLS